MRPCIATRAASPAHQTPSHITRRAAIHAAAALAVWRQLPADAAAAAAPPGAALSPSDAVRELYDASAASYDALDDGPLARALGFLELRAALLRRARGDVLELGVGTGLNLPAYPWRTQPPRLTSLTAVDLSDGMLAAARTRAAALVAAGALPAGAVTLVRVDAAALPYPASSFDCVLDTFSLCTFAEPGAALREAARVLRPGGRLLLLEHARSRAPLLGAYQDATAATIAAGGGRGCVWNQRVPELVAAAGFQVLQLKEHLGGLLVSLEAAPIEQ
eukprot:scaffold4.g4799.t1